MPTSSENPGIKRHATLVKKASQLSILCDAEVAIIAFSRDGKLHEYSSTTMEHTLSRYNSHSTNKNNNNNNNKAESRPPKVPRRKQVEETKSCSGNINDRALDAMERKVAALRLEKAQRMGKKLEGLSKEELCALEEQQILALLAVNNKKKELVVELLQRSRSTTVAEKEKLLMARGFEGITMREKPHVIQDNAPSRMASCTNSKPIKLFNCIIQ